MAPPFERHLFVCTNARPASSPRGCCASKGGAEVVQALKAAVKAAGLKGRVRAQAAGCLDLCEAGVSAVVYPEGIWYAGLTPEDAEELVREQLGAGRPVERLRWKGPK